MHVEDLEVIDLPEKYISIVPEKVGELRILKNDIAVWAASQRWIKENPNPDDTNPYTRTVHLWNHLPEQGHAVHKFNYRQYKAIGEAFSDHGCIEWTACRHYPGVDHQGVACKWYIKDVVNVEVGEKEDITVKGRLVRSVQVTPYEYHNELPLLFSPSFRGQEWWELAEERLEMTFTG